MKVGEFLVTYLIIYSAIYFIQFSAMPWT